jgi:hypothetical protein
MFLSNFNVIVVACKAFALYSICLLYGLVFTGLVAGAQWLTVLSESGFNETCTTMFDIFIATGLRFIFDCGPLTTSYSDTMIELDLETLLVNLLQFAIDILNFCFELYVIF